VGIVEPNGVGLGIVAIGMATVGVGDGEGADGTRGVFELKQAEVLDPVTVGAVEAPAAGEVAGVDVSGEKVSRDVNRKAIGRGESVAIRLRIGAARATENVTSVPDIRVAASTKDTAKRNGTIVAAGVLDMSRSVILMVDGLLAGIFGTIFFVGSVVAVAKSRDDVDGRGAGNSGGEIIDKVTADLVDGFHRVAAAVEGDDFVGDECNGNQKDGDKGDSKGKFDERKAGFSRFPFVHNTILA